MATKLALILALAIASSLGACAKKPDPNTFGGRLELAGGDVAAIGKQWNDGQAKIDKGNAMIEDGEDDIATGKKMIKKGESRIDKGETKIERGKRMIVEGEKTIAEAETAYNNRINVPQLPAAN